VNLDGLAFNKNRLESLDAEADAEWERGSEEPDGLDDIFKDVPNRQGSCRSTISLRLDGGAMPALFEPVIDEGLEQFERHLFGRPHWLSLSSGPTTMTDRPE
jgi:hypothetical protein